MKIAQKISYIELNLINNKEDTTMKAEVTMSQIWFNKSLSNSFFREQAYKTLEELVNRSTMSNRETIDALEDATDGMDIDEVEEIFYSESIECCADEFGIELQDEENVDEE